MFLKPTGKALLIHLLNLPETLFQALNTTNHNFGIFISEPLDEYFLYHFRLSRFNTVQYHFFTLDTRG